MHKRIKLSVCGSPMGVFEQLPTELCEHVFKHSPEVLFSMFPVSKVCKVFVQGLVPRVLHYHTGVTWNEGPGGWWMSDRPLYNETFLWIHFARKLYSLHLDPESLRKSDFFCADEVSWESILQLCRIPPYDRLLQSVSQPPQSKSISKIRVFENNTYSFEDFYQADVYFSLARFSRDWKPTTVRMFQLFPSLWKHLEVFPFKMSTAVNTLNLRQGKKDFLLPVTLDYKYETSKSMEFTAVSIPYITEQRTHDILIANFMLDLTDNKPLGIHYVNHIVKLSLCADGSVLQSEITYDRISNHTAWCREKNLPFILLQFYSREKEMLVALPSDLFE